MTRRPIILLGTALAVPLTALAVAGCGGDNGADTASASSSNAGTAAVDVASGKLGKILVDSKGRTLYLFEKDTTSKSTCSGACASAWPPFRTSGKPSAGTGVQGTAVETTPRSDGQPQVTYDGHPLYYYAGDQKPGDTNGEGLTQFGAAWYAVSPTGAPVEGGSSSASGGSGSNGGY